MLLRLDGFRVRIGSRHNRSLDGLAGFFERWTSGWEGLFPDSASVTSGQQSTQSLSGLSINTNVPWPSLASLKSFQGRNCSDSFGETAPTRAAVSDTKNRKSFDQVL